MKKLFNFGVKLKEAGTYFKRRRVIHTNFQDFLVVSLQGVISNCLHDIHNLIYSRTATYFHWSIGCIIVEYAS